MKGISILEAMAASGLRAIRYAKEIPGLGQVIANDMDQDAVTAIQRNIEFNGVQDAVTAHRSDARLLLLQHEQVCLSRAIHSLTFFNRIAVLDDTGDPH